MTDKETKELIRGVSRHDRHAQQRMLQSYGSMVFGLISRIITSQEDAEEIYQDVFVKIFRNIDAYDESKASLATWISRIAYNECVSFTRRNKPPVIYVDDSEVDLESIQDDALTRVFQQQDEPTILLIEKALDYLPPEELALITMFYFDDKSIKDIAFITESTPTNVATRLCRTRRKLYRIIKSVKE
jgi:RNA polymerase sigma-70 factor (ECF subfamily)